MNAKLLKSKMVLYGDDSFCESLSKLLNITRQTASAKLNGKSDFTQPEISTISKHYCLSDEEIRKIFVEGEDNESERMCAATQ